MSTACNGEKALAPPPVQPRFEHIARIWDRTHGVYAARILPGEYYVTAHEEMITTVLGSCVSACVRDPATGVGGMNHFMLPGKEGKDPSSWSGQDCLVTRYGIAAMETLINDVLKLGARRDRLELKLFGGGDVLKMRVNNIGERNIEFVKQFVKAEAMNVAAEDLGGPHPRKVNYFPKSGKVLVRRLRSLQSKTIVDREMNYEEKIAQKSQPGEIELFD